MADKIVTVGTTGTYATLSAALAGEVADLTSTGYNSGPGRLIINCQNVEDTTVVNHASTSWATSTSYYVLIQAADAHGGAWNSTGAYRLVIDNVTVSNVFTIDQSKLEHIHVKGLQIYNGSNGNLCNAIRSTGAPSTGFMRLEGLVIALEDDVDDALRGMRLEESNIDYSVWNSVIYAQNGNTGSQGIQVTGASAKVFVSNCTIDSIAEGLNAANPQIRLVNTRVTNVTTVAGAGLHTDSNNNLTDNSTSVPANWGAASIDGGDSPTISYVNSTGALTARDYHIQAGDSGIGAGADLSSSTGIAFSDDIDGDTRG